MNNVEKIIKYHNDLSDSIIKINHLLVTMTFLEKIKHPVNLVKKQYRKYRLVINQQKFKRIYNQLCFYGVKSSYLRSDDNKGTYRKVMNEYNFCEKKLIKYINNNPIKK